MNEEMGNTKSKQTQSTKDIKKKEVSGIQIENTSKRKIHPVVIFPFAWKKVNEDLAVLYEHFISNLASNTDIYAQPITVMDYKTYYANAKNKYDQKWKEKFIEFIEGTVELHSKLVKAWCVDTCQMWNTGLGEAFNKGGDRDVYWLIPGDFFYSKRKDVVDSNGKNIFDLLKQIPEAVRDHNQDFCIGEIEVHVNSSKQLIDTYSTYGLLYNWFPHEAQKIRKITDKPRAEFFAISGSFLEEVLRQRWYAYEQTIVMLLHGIISRKRIHRIPLGSISDLPEGRETLASAMQQVERTERVLKMVWREQNEQESGWIDRYRILDKQSGQVRGAAIIILQNLLG